MLSVVIGCSLVATGRALLTQSRRSVHVCTISENLNIEGFDKAQISLLSQKASTRERTLADVGSRDKWVVRSPNVSIQARYMDDDQVPENKKFVRALAIGGNFMAGNTLIVGSLEDGIKYNRGLILQDNTSHFNVDGDQFQLSIVRSNESSLVQDLSKTNQGVDIFLPSNNAMSTCLSCLPSSIKITVNRLPRFVNFAIRMPSQIDGQDGLCGNFNGIGADDSLELLSERSALDVSPEASLFSGETF